MPKQEKEFDGLKLSGFLVLLIGLILIAFVIWIDQMQKGNNTSTVFSSDMFVVITFVVVTPLLIKGFVIIEPNEACVLLFFGKYRGTITSNGYFWVNPLFSKKKLTLRMRNLETSPIKVNDQAGNPIMIGSVIVWRVKDTYKAMFNVDTNLDPMDVPKPIKKFGDLFTMDQKLFDSPFSSKRNMEKQELAEKMKKYEQFVRKQSDAALREVAGRYVYDNARQSGDAITLGSGNVEINDLLEAELNNRLAIAGIEIVEARINYLAYAAEIASAMLRRQQAEAIIVAREKIVDGAVGMVESAIDELEQSGTLKLDAESRVAMVGKLLVILCADDAEQPIVNA